MDRIEYQVKLITRYVMMAFVMYLAWYIVQPDYLSRVKDLGEIASAAVYGSVYGALTMLWKYHTGTTIEK